MKRSRPRMSTLMLVVIVALSFALVARSGGTRGAAEQQTRFDDQRDISRLRQFIFKLETAELQAELDKLGRSSGGAGGVGDGQ